MSVLIGFLTGFVVTFSIFDFSRPLDEGHDLIRLDLLELFRET